MAEITITGAADELSSAVQSVAEAEKQRQQEAEEAARKAEQEYQEREKEITEEVQEEDTHVADQQFDFAAAFQQLGDTLSAKLDELKPQPSEEETRTTRLAALKAELAELEPDSGKGEQQQQQPATPPKKKTAAPPADDGKTPEETQPPARKWYSWS